MRVLVIDDDRKAAGLLARGLAEEQFVVDVAHSAEDGDAAVASSEYDLLIVDWMLPGKQGSELCADLRRRGDRTPILMLTARGSIEDRVEGLKLGADDYLAKPFAFEELIARAHALLRRSDMAQASTLQFDDLVLDPINSRATRGGRLLDLTPKEFAILHLLMRRPGDVVSRARLAEQVWKSDLVVIDNLIDVHLSNLRRKVDVPGARPLIQTVRGRGFRLAAER